MLGMLIWQGKYLRGCLNSKMVTNILIIILILLHLIMFIIFIIGAIISTFTSNDYIFYGNIVKYMYIYILFSVFTLIVCGYSIAIGV